MLICNPEAQRGFLDCAALFRRNEGEAVQTSGDGSGDMAAEGDPATAAATLSASEEASGQQQPADSGGTARAADNTLTDFAEAKEGGTSISEADATLALAASQLPRQSQSAAVAPEEPGSVAGAAAATNRSAAEAVAMLGEGSATAADALYAFPQFEVLEEPLDHHFAGDTKLADNPR